MTKVYFYTLRLVVSTGQQYQHNFTLICLVKKKRKGFADLMWESFMCVSVIYISHIVMHLWLCFRAQLRRAHEKWMRCPWS